MEAATRGDLALARTLLYRGADVKAKAKNGWSPLLAAASNGHTEVVKLLLDKGADPNAKGADGSTALIFAANYGHAEVVRVLLDKGVAVNIRNSGGATALLEAAANMHSEVVKLLRAHGAEMTLTSAAMLGDRDEVQRLIEAGADLNAMEGEGWTALRGSACQGHIEVVRLLLDKGAQIISRNTSKERSAGNTAHSRKRSAVAELDLEKGPLVVINDTDGLTALQRAAQAGHVNVVTLLLTKAAQVNATYKDATAALAWACWYERTEVAKVLKALGIEETLTIAAMLGNEENVQLFIEAGSAVNSKGMFGLTPLVHAAAKGRASVVKLLLDKGADPDVKGADGSTALMWTFWYGHSGVARLLLEYGASVNAKHRQGLDVSHDRGLERVPRSGDTTCRQRCRHWGKRRAWLDSLAIR